MSVHLRSSIWLPAGAVGFLAVLLLAVLVPEGEQRKALKTADVEGTWSAAGGERLTVRADGSAELERVRAPEAGCGQSTGLPPLAYTGPATWEFDTYPDEGPGIRFDFQGPGAGKSCKVYLVVPENGGKGFLPHKADVQYVRSTGGSG
uniref:Proteinase inhibitor I42 chagasin domain-containing protein n=1 Tax=Streptomyces sp. NBC_00049 TaxID=2903617 RepID=A0AAU2JQU4_9ACTN